MLYSAKWLVKLPLTSLKIKFSDSLQLIIVTSTTLRRMTSAERRFQSTVCNFAAQFPLLPICLQAGSKKSSEEGHVNSTSRGIWTGNLRNELSFTQRKSGRCRKVYNCETLQERRDCIYVYNISLNIY